MTIIQRRRFLQSAAAVGTVAVTGAAAPAIAQDSRELKMVTSWPQNFPGLGTGATRLAQRIETASGGRFRVRVFAAGELVPPLRCHDAVQEGTAELYHSADYYYQGKHKAYNFFTAIPFGMSVAESDAWIHFGGGQALWDEVGAEFGIKHLVCGNTGPQMGFWFKEPITSLEDFRGKRIRTPGLGGDVVNAIGGTAVTLPAGEILQALQSGTLDGAEWVGPWNDLALGFHRVVQHYYYPGFQEPSAALSFGMSRQFWDSLSDADKLMFESCAAAENNVTLAEFNANNASALNTLIKEHGVQVHEYPEEIIQAAAAASQDAIAAVAADNDLARRVYESYMAFRQQIRPWTSISELASLSSRDTISW